MRMGNNVRTFRLAAGESLRSLALAVGMDVGQLSKLERGKVGCGDEAKVALARHFHTSLGRLFFQESVEVDSTPAGVAR